MWGPEGDTEDEGEDEDGDEDEGEGEGEDEDASDDDFQLPGASRDEPVEPAPVAAQTSQESVEDHLSDSQPTIGNFFPSKKGGKSVDSKPPKIGWADRSDKVVLSFFDHSTLALQPWREAGFTCFAFDIQHPEGETIKDGVHCRRANLFHEAVLQQIEDEFKDRAVFVSGFPPCTDLSCAGAKHWKRKAKDDPNFMNNAAGHIKRLRDRLLRWRVPFFLENPATGQLKTYIGTEGFKFHPDEFGVYLQKDDVHPVKGFPPRDRYKKLTGLWTSGSNFKKPVRRAVKPQKFVITEVPSKDRSHTPRGFARAVCLANYQHV